MQGGGEMVTIKTTALGLSLGTLRTSSFLSLLLSVPPFLAANLSASPAQLPNSTSSPVPWLLIACTTTGVQFSRNIRIDVIKISLDGLHLQPSYLKQV